MGARAERVSFFHTRWCLVLGIGGLAAIALVGGSMIVSKASQNAPKRTVNRGCRNRHDRAIIQARFDTLQMDVQKCAMCSSSSSICFCLSKRQLVDCHYVCLFVPFCTLKGKLPVRTASHRELPEEKSRIFIDLLDLLVSIE